MSARKTDAYEASLLSMRQAETSKAAKVHASEQAVIRAAKREHTHAPRDHFYPPDKCPVCRALDRLDRVTRGSK